MTAPSGARDIRAYAHILLRYAPLIVGITLATTAVAIVYSFTAEKEFEAQVTLRIKRDTPNIFPSFDNAMFPSSRDLEYYQTQIKLFYSRTMIKSVLEGLKVQHGMLFEPDDDQANQFMKKITVRPEPRTQLVRVVVSDKDPRNAQLYANMLADKYIEAAINDDMLVAGGYNQWFVERIADQEKRIADLERNLRIIEGSNQVGAAEFKAANTALGTKMLELAAAQARLGTNGVLLGDTEKNDLSNQIADLELSVASYRTQLDTMASNDVTYSVGIGKQQLETARTQYERLLKLSEEGMLMATKFNPQTITIIDRALQPKRPSKPRKTLNLIIGLLFGIVLGSSISFYSEYIDDTIKTPRDIEGFLHAPFLGLIPALTKNISETAIESIVDSEPKGTIAEAYRAIRTNILFSSDRKINRMVVTSAGPGEGKTTTAVNIAHVMARAGDRTLLLDADMRRPRIHKVFSLVSGTRGLSNYLVGEATIDEVIYPTIVPTLFVMPAGIVPPNPVELLNSPRLAELFKILATKYDRVIIDTPPVIAVTDPAILSRMADAVIFAVHGGRAHRDVVQRALETLRNVGGHILGVILNNVNVFRASYYDYYYYSYYRYAYGYKYGYYSEEQKEEKKRKKRRKAEKAPPPATPAEL